MIKEVKTGEENQKATFGATVRSVEIVHAPIHRYVNEIHECLYRTPIQ